MLERQRGTTERRDSFRPLTIEVDSLALYAVVSTALTRDDTPAIVLVHGLGLSHRYMMPLARELADHACRVYAPDLPGFGSSGHPPFVLDVPGLADALASWMMAIGLKQAVLVGNSFGCQIIADMAARHPDQVAGAVLQGPTTPPNERTWLQQFVRWRQNAPYNPPELGPISYADYRRSGYGRVWRTFRYSLRDRMEDKLARITAPVLVVRGQHDPICRAPWAAEVARRLPNGSLAEIPNVAHTLCYTAPIALAAVTKQFLNQAPAENRPSAAAATKLPTGTSR